VSRLSPSSLEHPWSARYDFSGEGERFAWVRPSTGVVFNSAFPYGRDDGAVWAGRGLTGVVQAGAAVRWGPVSATLAPVAFWAQNTSFPLATNGRGEGEALLDSRIPTWIDLPQRFGES